VSPGPPRQRLAMRWPEDKLFWAVLEAAAHRGPRSARPLTPGELLLLEPELPVPQDQVHAVALPMARGGGRGTENRGHGNGVVLAIAARHADLDALDPRIVHLSPASIPACVREAMNALGIDETTDLSSINLLVGARTPDVVRRGRQRMHALAALLTLALVLVASVGLHRRVRHWTALAASDAQQASDLVRAALGSSGDADQLFLTVGRERSLAQRRAAIERPRDAALDLAGTLSAWPSSASAQVHALTVNSAGVALSLSTEGDPTPFLASLKLPARWTLEEPRLNTLQQTTRVSLTMHPGHPDKGRQDTGVGALTGGAR